MFITKLQLIAGGSALFGLILGSIAPIGAGVSTENERQTKTQIVLSPVDESIDSKTIAEYEKLGAVFGGFIKPHQNSHCLVFQQGSAAAKVGLPGFYWSMLPTGDFPKLPRVQIPFGIEIRSRNLTDAAVKELAELKNIESLTLTTQRLTDAGVKELGSLKNLKSLTLHSQRLTDSGVKELAKLKNLSSLTLHSRRLTDDGIKELAALNNLDSLTLYSSNVSDKSTEEFKKALPKCLMNAPVNFERSEGNWQPDDFREPTH